jgi:hypothetical protein
VYADRTRRPSSADASTRTNLATRSAASKWSSTFEELPAASSSPSSTAAASGTTDDGERALEGCGGAEATASLDGVLRSSESERPVLRLRAPNAARNARSPFTIVTNVFCLTTRAKASPSRAPSSTWVRAAANFATAPRQSSRAVVEVSGSPSMVAGRRRRSEGAPGRGAVKGWRDGRHDVTTTSATRR